MGTRLRGTSSSGGVSATESRWKPGKRPGLRRISTTLSSAAGTDAGAGDGLIAAITRGGVIGARMKRERKADGPGETGEGELRQKPRRGEGPTRGHTWTTSDEGPPENPPGGGAFKGREPGGGPGGSALITPNAGPGARPSVGEASRDRAPRGGIGESVEMTPDARPAASPSVCKTLRGREPRGVSGGALEATSSARLAESPRVGKTSRGREPAGGPGGTSAATSDATPKGRPSAGHTSRGQGPGGRLGGSAAETSDGWPATGPPVRKMLKGRVPGGVPGGSPWVTPSAETKQTASIRISPRVQTPKGRNQRWEGGRRQWRKSTKQDTPPSRVGFRGHTYIKGPRRCIRRQRPEGSSYAGRTAVMRCLLGVQTIGRSGYSFVDTRNARMKNLEKVMRAVRNGKQLEQPADITHPGFEFNPRDWLRDIFGQHPSWNWLDSLLTDGARYPLVDIEEGVRLRQIRYMLGRGNHGEGMRETKEAIEAFITKELKKGYIIPIPRESVYTIPGSAVCPIHIAWQATVGEDGRPGVKGRPCHNLSFTEPGFAKMSVNARHRDEDLPMIQYGHAFLRLMNFIVALRWRFPGRRIYIQKFDVDGAYKRINLDIGSALQTIFARGETAFISTRTPFGGKSAGHFWGCVSEMLADFMNQELKRGDWPMLSARTPRLANHHVDRANLEEDVPFETVEEPLLLPDLACGQIMEVYVDDFMAVSLDRSFGGLHATDKVFNVALNSLDVMFRHKVKLEPEGMVREEAASVKKLDLESQARETGRILGWDVDTRRMRIALPAEKEAAWTETINQFLTDGHCSAKEMERTIGRLVRASIILPGASAYIVHLRRIFWAQKRSGSIVLDKRAREHLAFWCGLLEVAKRGTKIASLVLRMPTRIFFTDAAGAGMGGYCHETSRGWRFAFPPGILKLTTINHLEFLAGLVFPLLLRHEHNVGHNTLGFIDNTNAVAWTTKAPRSDDFADFLFRAHADILLERKSTMWYTHVPGEENFVADILSRKVGHSPREVVDKIIMHGHTHSLSISKQIRVMELPEDIVSWISSTLRRVMQGGQWPQGLPPLKHERGGGGSGSAQGWKSTPSAETTITRTNNASESRSLQGRAGEDFAEQLASRFRRTTCEKLWKTWVRPSCYEAGTRHGDTSSEGETKNYTNKFG